MNICIINPGFQMGGAERVNTEIANLLSIENKVALIDFSGKNSYFYEVMPSINKEIYFPKKKIVRKLIARFYKLYCRIIKIPPNPIILYKEQIQSLEQIIKNNDYDIVIMSQGELTSFIPYLKSKIHRTKFIAWQHNSFDVYTTKYYKSIIDYYFKGIELADCVMCLTKHDEHKFKKFNFNSFCIYNPLTIENPLISNVKKKNILFVGHLSIEQKGLDLLIKIAKRLKSDWKILVAGDGPDKEKFIRKIQLNNLEERIIMKGNLNSNELRHFYTEGSIFVSTSRWEGFGLVITEAMAAGLPIVSFDTTGASEILSYGEYGFLVNKYDVNDFSKKLSLLMNDISRRKYWQVQSLERSKYFSKRSIINRWNSVLKLVLTEYSSRM